MSDHPFRPIPKTDKLVGVPAPQTGRDFEIMPEGDIVHLRRRRRKSSVILLQSSEEEASQRTGFIVLAVGPDVTRFVPGDYVLVWPGEPAVAIKPRQEDIKPGVPPLLELLVHEEDICAKIELHDTVDEGDEAIGAAGEVLFETE